MKKNEIKNGKRRAAAVIAIVLIFALVLSFVVPLFGFTANAMPMYYGKTTTSVSYAEGGAPETETTQISEEDAAVSSESLELNAEVGYDGVFMINRQTPVKVTLYNNGEDFKGKVSVKVFSTIKTMYQSGSYILYEQDVDLNSGGAGEYKFTVFPEAAATYMNVKVYDESGNVVASANPAVTPYTPEQVMTAVVTDTKSNSLDYLKNLYIGEDIYTNTGKSYSTNYVTFLNGDSFPDSSEMLEAFGAIIIDDFHSESFSDSQKSALLNWVDKGGLLVIGTGLNAEKTLKGLDSVFNFSLNGYDKAVCFGGTANIADISIPNAEVLDSENRKALTQLLDEGDGKIVVHSYELGEDPVTSMNGIVDYLSVYYRNILPGKFSASRNYNYYPNQINSINRLPSIEKSQLTTLIGILFAYIIIVGPICYLVLKKKDKREKGWIVIPAIAVIFTGAIFIISASSYQKDALLNFMSYTNFNSKSPETSVSLGIRTPDKGDVTLAINDKLFINDNSDYYYYDNYNASSSDIDKCLYAVKTDDTSTAVTYFDQSSWQSNIINTAIPSESEDGIDGSFTVEGSNLVGKITNNMDADLMDVIVGFAGQYQKVGYIAAGETIDVSVPLAAEEYQKWMDNGYQLIRQMFYGLDENEYQDSMIFRKGVSATEAYKLEQRYNLFNSMAYQYSYDLRENGIDVSVIAFSEKNLIEGEKKLNGKATNENWENMYVKDFKTDLSKSSSYNIPEGYIFADQIYLNNESEQTYWDINYYQLYTMSSQNVTCEYNLKNCGNVTSIAVNWENYDAFSGDPMVYNYDTGSYEPIATADLNGNASAYISDDGVFKLYADVYSDTYITLPKVSLKGGNK